MICCITYILDKSWYLPNKIAAIKNATNGIISPYLTDDLYGSLQDSDVWRLQPLADEF